MEPMNDPERALTAALRVEPSPAFTARVRARIAAEPAPARWRMPRLALATASLALVALAANLILARPEPITPADAAHEHGEGKAILLPHHTLAVVEPLRVAPPSIVPRLEPRRRGYTMPSDVQVSRSEMLALQRLFAGEIVAPPPGDVPVEVVIAPITIDAITLPAVLGGERQ
jgi:hypothetical protein